MKLKSNDALQFKSINLADPRQDVHRERNHDPNLHRYSVAEKLIPAHAEGLSVLELGGGTAELSRRMQRKDIRVTFVDLSEHNIANAKALGFKAHRLDLNLGLPPFENEQFDGIVMLEIVEHVVAAELLLSEVCRVLKPGGFVILSTPNFAFFLNRLRILFGKLSHDEGYHYRFFTPKVLAKRIQDAGLSIDKTAHSMPAFGLNFFRNKIFKRSRIHLHVPDTLSSLLASTLIIRARRL